MVGSAWNLDGRHIVIDNVAPVNTKAACLKEAKEEAEFQQQSTSEGRRRRVGADLSSPMRDTFLPHPRFPHTAIIMTPA